MKKKVITRICSGLAVAILVMTQVSGRLIYAKESTGIENFLKEDKSTETISEDIEAVAVDEMEKEVITIKSAEELLAVARKCNNDRWSIDKRIELNEDISLADIDFDLFRYLRELLTEMGIQYRVLIIPVPVMRTAFSVTLRKQE